MKKSILLCIQLQLLFTIATFSQWNQFGNKIIPDDNINESSFGESVAISADGNTLVVGGMGDNNHYGAAWIYVFDGTQWVKQAKLIGTGAITNVVESPPMLPVVRVF